MARAYTHIGRDKGIVVQTIDYIQQRTRELRELISKSEAEHAQWSELFEMYRDKLPDQPVGRIEKRMQKLGTRMRRDRIELEDLEELETALLPCKRCNGHGHLRHFCAQDHSETETCPACKGKGSLLSL